MSLSHVSSEISEATAASGRPVGSVELIAVSKVQPNERVLEVLRQGHRVFGETVCKKLKASGQALRLNFQMQRCTSWVHSNLIRLGLHLKYLTAFTPWIVLN